MTTKEIINHPVSLVAFGAVFAVGAFLIPHFWKLVIITLSAIVMIVALWHLFHNKNITTLGNMEWKALLIFEIIGIGAILYFAKDYLFTFE